jgi:4'-phosphopantetheinyl transferase EntD
VISKILPACVVAAEQLGTHSGLLLEQEAETLGRSIPSRRREFAAGRTRAREALSALGLPVQPILRGSQREPLWPDGIVGSITHCEGYSAAVVARREDIVSIGIDAEPNRPLPEGVLAVIARQEEISSLGCVSSSHINWDRLLFSAKESLYKAWYPLMKCWLGFDGASLKIDPDNGSFQIRIMAAASRKPGFSDLPMVGRYVAQRDFILTAVTIASATFSEGAEWMLSATE